MQFSREGVCNVPGCNNKIKAKLLCEKHYKRLNKNGTLNKVSVSKKEIPTCLAIGCDNQSFTKGLCKYHYQTQLDTGSPFKPKNIKLCGIEGCNNTHLAKGLCSNHYKKWEEILYKNFDENYSDKKNYSPKDKTRKLIPDIERLYYSEGYSITKTANQLNLSFDTVESVIVHVLHGKKSRSDIAKSSFHRLTEEQKKNFVESATEKRLSDDGYIEKLAITKLGIKNPASKLDEEKVQEIRKLYVEMLMTGYLKTEAQIVLAEKFGVKRPTISDVVLKKTWKHIE